jgi:hypothetical protein
VFDGEPPDDPSHINDWLLCATSGGGWSRRREVFRRFNRLLVQII